MHFEGYVDIFDAGPVLQGRVGELRAVRESVQAVAVEGMPDEGAVPVLVSNTVLGDFRMIVARSIPGSAHVALTAAEMTLLRVQAGAAVRTLSLTAAT